VKFPKRVMRWHFVAELRFDPKSPIIGVSTKIYGEQTRRIKMALDTGATFVMIPWEIADTLGYHPYDSSEKTKIITASGIQYVPIITLKSMSVIGMKAESVILLFMTCQKRAM
jgi:predicted ferric reductase